MTIRKAGAAVLLLLLCLALTGCRVRTSAPGAEARPEETASGQASLPGPRPDEDTPDDREAEKETPEADPGDQTREDPGSPRRAYDENAPAEILPGAERAVQGEGEGSGAFAPGNDADPAAAKLNAGAEDTASRTAPAEEADRTGVSEDAEEADSAMTYFTVLLQDRMGSLFECQRMNVYWETPADHVTIHKTSPEHALILNAGAYDVSARLLPENLRVDDGWIGRKNPDVVVKVVDSGVLGSGTVSDAAARGVCAALLSREGWAAMGAVQRGRVLLLSEELLRAPYLQTAAMLAIAKTANPDVMADVDVAKALEMLTEEATGVIPSGIFFYGLP